MGPSSYDECDRVDFCDGAIADAPDQRLWIAAGHADYGFLVMQMCGETQAMSERTSPAR